MLKFLIVLGFIALVILFFAMYFGLSFLAYWLTFKAGAPQYVAVIVGVATFLILGITARLSNNKN